MSKSRKNVIDPEEIIGTYGADTARLFMLSDSPPERDLEWTAAGVEGAWRYLNRLWRLVTEPALALPPPDSPPTSTFGERAQALRRVTHKTIAAVTDDLDKFRFNRAVARIRELTNALGEIDNGDAGDTWALREGLEAAVRLIGPLTPHLAEELWHQLGHETMLTGTAWPQADATLLVDESITIAVQVNGKLRGTVDLPRDVDKELAESAALELPAVARATDGKTVRKVIVVPNRVINVVV
jgi:leucyl-tRNA synthetase